MSLNSPWALGFLSFIPLLILMYILKQKFEEREIGSIFLWQQVLKDVEVNTPWQKLKKNLLLLLQILFVLLAALALSDPYLKTVGSGYANLIIVIDNTGSMNTRYENVTRLEQAKALAENAVKSAAGKANITLIRAGRYPELVLSKTADKGEAVAAIRRIAESSTTGNMADAVSLVKAIAKAYETQGGYKAIFYTDGGISAESLNAEVVRIYTEAQNVSLDYISHTVEKGKLKALVRMTNRSKSDAVREVSLYGDEVLLELQSLTLPAGETRTASFEVTFPQETGYIWAELTEADDLSQDNAIYGVVSQNKALNVLLVTDSNIFIEKALLGVKGIALYKTNPGEKITGDYDLYIYDGNMPETLPKSGSLLFLNPPSSLMEKENGVVLFEIGEEQTGGTATVLRHGITKYVEDAAFAVSGLKKLDIPYWAETLIAVGDRPAAAAGVYKGRKAAVIGFDLHNSDFVLMPEYPVFMNNLAAFLTDRTFEGKTAYEAGEPVPLVPLPEAKELRIMDAAGRDYPIALRYPIPPFEATGRTGIYEIRQKLEAGSHISRFAVNYPTGTESAVPEAVGQHSNAGGQESKINPGTGLQLWLILLLLLAALTEWGVYMRGY